MPFNVILKLWKTLKRQVFKSQHQFRYAEEFFNSNISLTILAPQTISDYQKLNHREATVSNEHSPSTSYSTSTQHSENICGKKIGVGSKGTLNKNKCTFYFTIYHSVSVTGMASSSTRNRSYRSSPNWNREDIVLLNAWIYSP